MSFRSILLPVTCCILFFYCEKPGSNITQETPSITKKEPTLVAVEQYDSVVAYDFDGIGDIVREGQLIINPHNQKILTEQEVIALDSIFTDPENYGGDVAMCFNPHFGIVYYKNDSIVNHIAVCMQCNYLLTSIDLPVAQSGFSATGRVKINNLTKMLSFRYIEDRDELL